jgi:hypothetical protein
MLARKQATFEELAGMVIELADALSLMVELNNHRLVWVKDPAPLLAKARELIWRMP